MNKKNDQPNLPQGSGKSTEKPPEKPPEATPLATTVAAPPVSSRAGFGGSAAELGSQQGEVGAIAAVAREEGELKTAITLAQMNPRNEAKSIGALMRSCRLPSFCEKAIYSFPRGGSTIEGPGAILAREMGRCWGNMRWGVRIASQDDKTVHVRGYAYDLESNSYVEMEAKFNKLVQRKVKVGTQRLTKWVQPDERDLRELVNKHGAICVRNSILQLIPKDVVEDAMAAIKYTQVEAAKGNIAQDPVAAARSLIGGFVSIGVTEDQLKAHLGKSVMAVTAKELADLRNIYSSIRDGLTTAVEHFGIEATKEPSAVDENGSRAGNLADRLTGKDSKADAEQKEPQVNE